MTALGVTDAVLVVVGETSSEVVADDGANNDVELDGVSLADTVPVAEEEEETPMFGETEAEVEGVANSEDSLEVDVEWLNDADMEGVASIEIDNEPVAEITSEADGDKLTLVVNDSDNDAVTGALTVALVDLAFDPEGLGVVDDDDDIVGDSLAEADNEGLTVGVAVAGGK